MDDTLMTVIAIVLAAGVLLIFPLTSLAERNDDISLSALQATTNELVDQVRTTGELTQDEWTSFLSTTSSSGLVVEPEITVQILDENPGVKTTQANITKIGENVYYNLYTSQVEEQLKRNNKIVFKEGDMIFISLKIVSKSMAEVFRDSVYSLSGSDTDRYVAQYGGIVTVNGNR